MDVNLNLVGMEKGLHYETIITTNNKNQKTNSAPIGVICTGENTILCRIFKGSKTLENIIEKKEFVVNITSNPKMFTYSTINNIPEKYFDKISNSNLAFLKNSDSYLICKVTDLKEAVKRSDPVSKSEAIIIKAEVSDMIINNKCGKAMNRGIHLLIESLVNYTRIDIVDSQKQEYFLGRFKEAQRIINKVGSSEEKESLKILKESLKDKGFNL